MKRINKYISLLLATALLASCDKFDEINTDPDATTKVTSSLLATGLLLDITSSSASKSFIYDELLAKQMADRKSTRLNSSHASKSRMPSSA